MKNKDENLLSVKRVLYIVIIIRNPTMSFTKKFKLKYSSKVVDVTVLIFQERDTYRRKTTNVKKTL